MPLRALPDRPGWFIASGAATAPLENIPGVTWLPHVGASGSRALVHQSVLPLMVDDADATRLLCPTLDPPDWGMRDTALADRNIKLRTAQHSAIDYITQRRGTLLGDSPRVGKTLSAIMSHDPSTGPLVVICPAMVRTTWLSWLRRVFPDEPIGMFHGKTYCADIPRSYKLIVGHYEILTHWQSANRIGTLVFDEAHMLTNRKAARTIAATYLASKAARVICATGTPIWNMPPNLWSILTLISPGAFGNYYDFANRYGKPVPSANGTTYTGISNEVELQARLSEVMIRRRWIDVMTDLPPITRNVVLVELTVAKRRQLDYLMVEIEEKQSTAIGVMSRYREQVSRLKLATIVAEATAMLDRGEPVVIWTWHVGLATLVAEKLGERAHLLTGEISGKKRDGVIDAWRGSAVPTALVCTMSVAQVGLDFSHARLAIFGEIDYTPAIMEQAEMRTFAPTRPMNVTYVVMDHIVEQRLVLCLVKKLGAANPLGVGAANDAIEALRSALMGPVETPDLDRLLANILDQEA